MTRHHATKGHSLHELASSFTQSDMSAASYSTAPIPSHDESLLSCLLPHLSGRLLHRKVADNLLQSLHGEEEGTRRTETERQQQRVQSVSTLPAKFSRKRSLLDGAICPIPSSSRVLPPFLFLFLSSSLPLVPTWLCANRFNMALSSLCIGRCGTFFAQQQQQQQQQQLMQ